MNRLAPLAARNIVPQTDLSDAQREVVDRLLRMTQLQEDSATIEERAPQGVDHADQKADNLRILLL